MFISPKFCKNTIFQNERNIDEKAIIATLAFFALAISANAYVVVSSIGTDGGTIFTILTVGRFPHIQALRLAEQYFGETGQISIKRRHDT